VAPLFPAETLDFVGDEADDGVASTFATETMAELYLQQGFPDRALAIYRELAARNPEDSSLRERIAELTDADEERPAPAAATAARTAREFFGVLAYRRAPRAIAGDSVVAEPAVADSEPAEVSLPAESSPESIIDGAAEATPVESSEQTTGPSAEQPSAPAEARNGKPGREAESALSLDDVFRDSPVMESTGARNTLSFDEFFARRGNGSAEQAGDTVATEVNGSGTDREEHSSDDEPKDLELFHAWLDGLKG
jgi:hypothetical protein